MKMNVLLTADLPYEVADAARCFLEQKGFEEIIQGNGGLSFESSTVDFDGFEQVLEIARDNSKTYLSIMRSLEQDKETRETKIQEFDQKIKTLEKNLAASQKDKETLKSEFRNLANEMQEIAKRFQSWTVRKL